MGRGRMAALWLSPLRHGRGAAMLQKTPAEPENGLNSFIRTFDPDVPGYVFWLVMLALITFHQLVLHVR